MKKGYSADFLTDEDYRIAASNGISRDLAYKRFQYYGWARERAITEPINILNRRKPRSAIWWKYADKAIVSRNCFEYRISKGIYPVIAATKPSIRSKGENK